MEPGGLRESPAGSGESDAGDWREVTPGVDEEGKPAGTEMTAAETVPKEAREEGEKQRNVVEHLNSPHEEELDPRIQVWLPHTGSYLTAKDFIIC